MKDWIKCKKCGRLKHIDRECVCEKEKQQSIELEGGKNKMSENGWNIAVEGGAIAALPEEQRYAKIIEPAPEYRVDEGATNPEKTKVKLIMCVELADGRKADYYPNRTSARRVASILKTDLTTEAMKKWIGKYIVWGKIMDQMVGGVDKKVIYITDVKDNIPAIKVSK